VSNLLGLRNVESTGGDSFERVLAIASSLARAVDDKAGYRPSHCEGVSRLARAIGARLGVDGDELARLSVAGLLHDVGKLHVPDAILNKPTRLTAIEYEEIKQHPLHAHRVLTGLGLVDEARWILHHHERRDGGGYPTGLEGDAIPFASRILLVADTFDCLTTNRPYRCALTPRRGTRRAAPPRWRPVRRRRRRGPRRAALLAAHRSSAPPDPRPPDPDPAPLTCARARADTAGMNRGDLADHRADLVRRGGGALVGAGHRGRLLRDLAHGWRLAHVWLNWRIRASDKRIARLREQLAALDEQG
jgi:hypothetical protein